jgi:radical SAM superfamily enzyme YgiQ (UPF0313 family)
MNITLVNTNRIKPPIAPIGLEYIAEALNNKGHSIRILDLCWAENWKNSIKDFFKDNDSKLVCVTLRNTDDCGFASRQSFLKNFSDMVKEIRKNCIAPIIAGGVGFSTMPEQVMKNCNVDTGICGDGEFTLIKIAERIENNKDWHDLPNLIYRKNGEIYRNPSETHSLANLPIMTRSWFDNIRYFNKGGQSGFETKRGCSHNCIYCADPVAKGKNVRLRPPEDVAQEIENLLSQGIDHFHTCDCEFNYPVSHAEEICKELIKRGISEKIRWFAYCLPSDFTLEFAKLMKKAGCVGINFGVDNGDDRMLKILKRNFTSDDILTTVKSCRDAGIAVMFDLLLGAPGETEESVTKTIKLMKKASPDLIGVTVGVRVYPGTELSEMVKREDLNAGVSGEDDLSLFFLEPEIKNTIFPLIGKLIDGDKRFFFLDPSKPEKNYDYTSNEILVNAIKKGSRGAYWDILRKL